MGVKIVWWCPFLSVLVASGVNLTIGRILSIDGQYCKLLNTDVRCTRIDSHNFTEVTFDFRVNTATEINILDSYLHIGPEGLFDIYTKIQKLRISGVSLQQLPANIFKTGRSLQSLDLSHNKIGQIPDGTFKETPNLKEVNLSGNLLRSLEANVFSGISAPEIRLNLSDNILEKIDPNAFDDIDVNYIDLSKNKLRNLQFFKSIDPLEIDLSNNCLMRIPTETFGRKENLKKLYLENTCLVFFNEFYGAFPKSLRVLDISGSAMLYFFPELLATTPNLKQLISKRNIVQPKTIIEILEIVQLDQIDFSGLEFNCTDLAQITIAARRANTTYVVDQPIYDKNNINGYACTQSV